MKKTLLSAIFALFTTLLIAQPTLTTAYFVTPDDILETRIDTHPVASILPQGTGEQTWNYLALNYEGPTFKDTFLMASEGANSEFFPDAELVQIKNGGIEQYFNVTATQQEIIGYAGNDPVGLGIFVNAYYDEPLSFRTAPIHYNDQLSSTSSVSFAVDANQLPDSLLDLLSLTPDSIRVMIQSTETGTADAYGNMTIPGDDAIVYSVLRLNMLEYRNTMIFAKFSIGWVNVTGALPNVNGIGLDTIHHYDFYSDTEKEAIAKVYMKKNTTEVRTVQYKADIVTVATSELAPTASALSVYPNPAESDVTFQIDHVPYGKYTIAIHNILGATVWQKKYQISSGTQLIPANIEGLKKGTYLLSLINRDNQTVSTQKLIVIKP